METSIPSGLKKKERTSLPCWPQPSHCVLQVKARSDGETNVVECGLNSRTLTSSSLATRARSSSSPQSLMLPVSNGRTFHLKPCWGWFQPQDHPQFKHWIHLNFPYPITEVKKVGWVEGTWHGAMSNPAPFTKQVAFPFSLCIWSHIWWLHFQ